MRNLVLFAVRFHRMRTRWLKPFRSGVLLPTACKTCAFQPQAGRGVRLRDDKSFPRNGLFDAVRNDMFLPGLFRIPAIDRDEARFAQATKQMVETGDYVDIRFQEDVRYKKPVGIYWLQSAVVKAPRKLGLPRAQLLSALSRTIIDRGDRRRAADLLGGARFCVAARRAAGGTDDVQLRRARGRGAARKNRCVALADRRRRDGRARHASICRGSAASIRRTAVEFACDLLDRAGRRHPAQGAVDPDVRRPDRSSCWRSWTARRSGCGACARFGA